MTARRSGLPFAEQRARAITRRRVLEFVHAQFPFLGALAIASIFFVLSESDAASRLWWLSGCIVAVGITVVAVVFPWRRVASGWLAVVPLVDIIAVALLSEGAVNSLISVRLLLVFPVLWLSYAFGVRYVAIAVLGTGLLTSLPLAIAGRLPTTVEDWSTVLMGPITIAFVAIAVSLAARRLREFQSRLEATSRELAASLARAEERESALHAVLDTVQAAIALIDPDGNVILSNETAKRVVAKAGVQPNGHVQDGVHVYLADRKTRVSPEQQIHVRAMRGESINGELFWFGPSNNQIAIVASTSTIILPSGDPYGHVIAAQEVTQLLESIKVREDFLASVSHEMKTPLTSIIGYLEIIEDAIDVDTHGVGRELGIVQRNVDRLLAVISDLLSAGRNDEPMQRRPTDIAVLVRTAIEAAQPNADTAGVQIAPFVSPQPRITQVDALKVGQVIDNLLSNAIKYTNRDGLITLELEYTGLEQSRLGAVAPTDGHGAQGTAVLADAHGAQRTAEPELSAQEASPKEASAEQSVLRVRDSGIGISPNDQRQLFDRFFRAESARVDAIPGVGLGLSIVNSHIAEHDGTVTIDSELGVGTTVTVMLPV